MKHNSNKSILSVLVFIAMTFSAAGKRYYKPHFAIGGKAGMTMSEMSFTPGVEQSMISGLTMGVTARYTEEKFFGLIAELNIEQRGWKETFEGTQLNYERQLTYVQLPLLTHIYFGSDKFKGFVNLGPAVSLLIGDNISSNFDYRNPSEVEGFPEENRHVNQMSMDIKNKFDYGILGGAGVELTIKKKHSIMLEARYYFGLGNVFPSAKKDEFSASRGTSIQVTLGYMFHIK